MNITVINIHLKPVWQTIFNLKEYYIFKFV